MTAVAPRVDRPVAPERPLPHGTGRRGNIFWELLTTTDHKMLGIMYIVMCYVWYVIGGIMALLIRAELFHPGMQLLSNEQYNQLFTMHGTIMLLAYGTPIVWGFANYIVPLQIGAPDVAFRVLTPSASGSRRSASLLSARALLPRAVQVTSAGPFTPR